jgi:hypothetical protein
MRRHLFAVLASLTLFAALPAASLAASHHGERHHRRHARVEHARVEHFRDSHGVASNPVSQDAGTVQTFTNGVLTIKLNDGSTVSGMVTGDSEIECTAMNRDVTREDGGPGPSGNGGSDRNGSDNGDQGDRGDDHGDRGDRGDRGDDHQNCVMALQAGAAVRDATLSLTGAGATWDRVDLDS